MKIRIFLVLSLLGLLLTSCSAVKVTREETLIPTYKPEKILIIGASLNSEARNYFEDELRSALQEQQIQAVSSYEFFEPEYFLIEKTSAKEEEFINWLKKENFDAVIYSEISGSSFKLSWIQSMEAFANDISMNPVSMNPQIPSRDEPEVKIYHIQTSLYCLCPTKDEKLIWQMHAEMRQPKKINKSINKYINQVLKKM